MVHSFYKYPSFKQVTLCSMHLIVTTFREAVIKVEVANFCAAMDTLIDQDVGTHTPSECLLKRYEYSFASSNAAAQQSNGKLLIMYYSVE